MDRLSGRDVSSILIGNGRGFDFARVWTGRFYLRLLLVLFQAFCFLSWIESPSEFIREGEQPIRQYFVYLQCFDVTIATSVEESGQLVWCRGGWRSRPK